VAARNFCAAWARRNIDELLGYFTRRGPGAQTLPTRPRATRWWVVPLQVEATQTTVVKVRSSRHRRGTTEFVPIQQLRWMTTGSVTSGCSRCLDLGAVGQMVGVDHGDRNGALVAAVRPRCALL